MEHFPIYIFLLCFLISFFKTRISLNNYTVLQHICVDCIIIINVLYMLATLFTFPSIVWVFFYSEVHSRVSSMNFEYSCFFFFTFISLTQTHRMLSFYVDELMCNEWKCLGYNKKKKIIFIIVFRATET